MVTGKPINGLVILLLILEPEFVNAANKHEIDDYVYEEDEHKLCHHHLPHDCHVELVFRANGPQRRAGVEQVHPISLLI